MGQGEDADGDFSLEGDYEEIGEIAIVRRYSYCTLGPEGVGIPYLYRGRWDGAVVSGVWKPIVGSFDGGPFEMWPEDPLLEITWREEREPEAISR